MLRTLSRKKPMSIFLLIRHGLNDTVNRRIAGRVPGVHLNPEGIRESEYLAEKLSRYPVHHIISSPLERAMETARFLAERLHLEVEIDEAFNEMNVSGWTGKSFEELESDPLWRRFNTNRSTTRAPGGETVLEVQVRFMQGIERLYLRFPDDMIAIFSHAEPIKTAVAYCIGIPLDFITRLEIGTASVSVIDYHPEWIRILTVNSLENLPLGTG